MVLDGPKTRSDISDSPDQSFLKTRFDLPDPQPMSHCLDKCRISGQTLVKQEGSRKFMFSVDTLIYMVGITFGLVCQWRGGQEWRGWRSTHSPARRVLHAPQPDAGPPGTVGPRSLGHFHIVSILDNGHVVILTISLLYDTERFYPEFMVYTKRNYQACGKNPSWKN